jgi:hypothetical protein
MEEGTEATEEARKIVFLDVDGVLNSATSIGAHLPIESDLLLLFKEILDQSGASIVVSSTWRLDMDAMTKLRQSCSNIGIDSKLFVGCTPTIPLSDIISDNLQFSYSSDSTQRCREIERYIEDFGLRARGVNWVCIDDLDLSSSEMIVNNFVKTRKDKGLTERAVSDAITILNRNPEKRRPRKSKKAWWQK